MRRLIQHPPAGWWCKDTARFIGRTNFSHERGFARNCFSFETMTGGHGAGKFRIMDCT